MGIVIIPSRGCDNAGGTPHLTINMWYGVEKDHENIGQVVDLFCRLVAYWLDHCDKVIWKLTAWPLDYDCYDMKENMIDDISLARLCTLTIFA